jgi:hypothetical protein
MARTTTLRLRSELPFKALDNVILQMLACHVGKPCPTTREIREWTGMAWRRIWPYLHRMQERGLIEIEVIESRSDGSDPKRRRMRAVGGEWTLWTARPGRPCAMRQAAE